MKSTKTNMLSKEEFLKLAIIHYQLYNEVIPLREKWGFTRQKKFFLQYNLY